MGKTSRDLIASGALLLLIAAARLDAQENTVSAAAATPLALNGDYWVGTESGPYMLQTHNGTIYPEKPFILVPKKVKPAHAQAIRADIAKTFKTQEFGDARILIAAEFYAAVLKEHPDRADFIKAERGKTNRFFKKKKKAIAFRLAKDRTEGSLR